MSDATDNPDLPPHQTDGWEHFCSGVLATEFGRRESEALARAVSQLSEEEMSESQNQPGARWFAWLSFPRFAVSMACALAVVMAGLVLRYAYPPASRMPAPLVGSVTGELNPVWADASKHPKAGDTLEAGIFRLKSGIIEITFNSKARVAIEGPAEGKWTGANSMELHSGKLSAEVPRPAHGFSVKTPDVTIVDLGTRFGVDTGDAQPARVDVFEGKIRLKPVLTAAMQGKTWSLTQSMAALVDTNGTLKATRAVSEEYYPQLSKTIAVHPSNCGFDGPGKMVPGSMPTDFGYWGGPAFEMAGTSQGVAPYEGIGMLRFLSSPLAKNSEVWQLVDLRPYKALLARHDVRIKSSAFFNRVRGNASSGKKFALTVAAFHGEAKNIENLWAHRDGSALAVAEKEITTDDDPATWEKVDVSAALPPETDYLIVSMRAVAPDNASASADPFPGHFADFIDCSLFEPLYEASTNH